MLSPRGGRLRDLLFNFSFIGLFEDGIVATMQGSGKADLPSPRERVGRYRTY